MGEPKTPYQAYDWQPPPAEGDDDSLGLDIPAFLARQMPIERSYRPGVSLARAVATGFLFGAAALTPQSLPAVLPQQRAQHAREWRQGDDDDAPPRPRLSPEEQAALDAALELPSILRRNG